MVELLVSLVFYVRVTAEWPAPSDPAEPVPLVCLMEICDDPTQESYACSTVSPLTKTFHVQKNCAVWAFCFSRDGLTGIELIECWRIALVTSGVYLDDVLFFDDFESGELRVEQIVGGWSAVVGELSN